MDAAAYTEKIQQDMKDAIAELEYNNYGLQSQLSEKDEDYRRLQSSLAKIVHEKTKNDEEHDIQTEIMTGRVLALEADKSRAFKMLDSVRKDGQFIEKAFVALQADFASYRTHVSQLEGFTEQKKRKIISLETELARERAQSSWLKIKLAEQTRCWQTENNTRIQAENALVEHLFTRKIEQEGKDEIHDYGVSSLAEELERATRGEEEEEEGQEEQEEEQEEEEQEEEEQEKEEQEKEEQEEKEKKKGTSAKNDMETQCYEPGREVLARSINLKPADIARIPRAHAIQLLVVILGLALILAMGLKPVGRSAMLTIVHETTGYGTGFGPYGVEY